jgi:hypothetical protein
VPEKSEQLKKSELAMAAALTSIKQRKFVMFFVENGGNGTAAAEAAGYAAPAASANDCLKNSTICEQIEKYSLLCTRNAGESRETILNREVNWASGDIRDFFVLKPILDNEGNPSIHPLTGEAEITEEMIPITHWTKEQAQRVKKISWNRNGPVLELHDPMRANRNLAEYSGMLMKEDQALNAEDAASLIGAAMARMDELDHTPTTSD